MSSAALTLDQDAWKPKYNPWLIAFVVALAAFMEVLDTSIANVALPYMAGSLAASNDQSTWVLTSYLVSNAIVLPISGWLAGAVGRKQFFTLCLIVFTISSLLCGFAPSLAMLLFFACCKALAAEDFSLWPKPFLLTPSHRNSAAWLSPSTALPPSLLPPSGPHSAAGSPSTTLGAGFFLSTSRWA